MATHTERFVLCLRIVLHSNEKMTKQLSKSSLVNPAFSQVFQGLERGKKLGDRPMRGSLPHGLGGSSGGFQDKPLQEYFTERLLELGSCEGRRSSRRCRGFAERNQSRCWAGRESGPAAQHSSTGMDSKAQQEIHSILKVYSGNFLELLTVPIVAPLEALVQEK